jgi:hypothetical protein
VNRALQLETWNSKLETFPSSSPLDRSFFRRVDLGLFRYWEGLAEQEPFDVIEEKVLRVRIGEIQPVVIDDLSLLLEPSGPTRLANLGGDSLPEFIRKRRETNRRPLLATVFTFNVFGHY